jgi:tetratricopeptide (TPR) repeat protein
MPVIIILIIILGTAIGFIIFFLIRSIIAPQRAATLANLVKQNKNAAAIRVAKKILTRDPRSTDGHYFLGLAYLAENKPELAMMELKTVNQIGQFTALCPEVPFRKKIAELYAKFNQPEEALKEYLILIKREPNSPEYHYLIGKLFEERNRAPKAVEYYRKTIELDGRHWNAHFHLGMILYKAKKPVEAKTELEISIKLNPENYAASFYLGRLLKENHDYVPALASFEKSQKDPEYKTKALVERGACFMSMNNFEKAISELERAIKLGQENEESEILYARYFLAICHEKMRNIELAIEQWEKIYAKKPNFRDVSEKLGQYHEFRQDDYIKDYITAGQDEFIERCKDLSAVMGLSVQDISPIPNGCQMVGVEAQSKWRNARKIPKLIRFLRIAEMVDESAIRGLHEEMKKFNVTRGILITSSTFSRLAMDFAESRPVELWNKDKLQELLKAADQAKSQ